MAAKPFRRRLPLVLVGALSLAAAGRAHGQTARAEAQTASAEGWLWGVNGVSAAVRGGATLLQLGGEAEFALPAPPWTMSLGASWVLLSSETDGTLGAWAGDVWWRWTLSRGASRQRTYLGVGLGALRLEGEGSPSLGALVGTERGGRLHVRVEARGQMYRWSPVLGVLVGVGPHTGGAPSAEQNP